MVQTLGVYTVNVLLDRALWSVAQRYPELACIQYSDAGISFAALASAAPPSDAAFEYLYEEMLVIMARLLGKDMARRLIDEITPDESAGAAPRPTEG
jgi:hypothetical protein